MAESAFAVAALLLRAGGSPSPPPARGLPPDWRPRISPRPIHGVRETSVRSETAPSRRRRASAAAPSAKLRAAAAGSESESQSRVDGGGGNGDGDGGDGWSEGGPPPTPCVRICRYNADFYDGRVCVGCFRESFEIGSWSSLAAAERSMALMDAADRRPSAGGTGGGNDRFAGGITRDELMRQAVAWGAMR